VLVRVPLEAIRDIEFPLRRRLPRHRGGRAAARRRGAYLDRGLPRAFTADGRAAELRAVAAARISLPSDRSFCLVGRRRSRTCTGAALPADDELPWQQALFDVLLEYPICVPADADRGQVRPRAPRHHDDDRHALLTPAGAERAFHYARRPGPRAARSALAPGRAALREARVPAHPRAAFDHLLFLLCLVIPFRRLRPLIVVVTSFTVAHSITLARPRSASRRPRSGSRR
jgi:hypothetical protein